MVTSREIRLKSRPVGMPSAENFELATVTVPAPAPGEVQVKNIWMTVDPYMRGRMVDRASRGEGAEGGRGGGLNFAEARHFWAAAPGVPGRCRHAGPDGLGGPVEDRGAEAWRRGLCLSRGRRRRLGRLSDRQDQGAHGHRIGGRRRQRRVSQADREATGNLTEALLQAAPNGLDVYFDSVGGEHLEAALTAANRFARFALCGMISQYNVAGMPAGPRNIMFAVGKSIRLEGFIVSNHFNLLPEFQKDMSGWIREGKLTWKETVEQGIENAPTAFLKLFKGENLGKMLVKLV